MIEDTELLQRYARQASEDAFAELVRRHIDLVYATALRRTNGQHTLAEEATQQTFISLARCARTLASHPTIAGWLYVTVRHAAATLLRSDQSRKVREQEAYAMDHSISSKPSVDWDSIRPELDHLIERLDARERDAVILRFYEGRKFSEIGATLQLSEDAARMRVERALEKLRRLLSRRGITSTIAALSLALTNQPAIAAPPGLAMAVSAAVLASGGVAVTAGIFTLMSTPKLVIGAIGLLVIIQGYFIAGEHRTNLQLRKEIADLHETADRALQSDRTHQRVRAPEPIGRAIDPSRVGHPRSATNTMESGPEAKPGPRFRALTRVEEWKDRGTATPAAALETYLWSGDRIDLEARARSLGFGALKPVVDEFFARLSPEIRDRYESPEKLWAVLLAGAHQDTRVTAFEVVSQIPDDVQAGNTVTLHVRAQKEGGKIEQGDMAFEHSADG